MFKPLLRILPSLSGNVKLCCNISDYDKTDDPHVFDCYVREAKLSPISSNDDKLFVNVNLLQGAYEFNIPSLYKKEHDFWSSKFVYDKLEVEYMNIDDYSFNDTKLRDTDFEFGCKRLSYQKQGKQFAFFAPIYVDDPDDLPEYFMIKLDYYIDRNKVDRKEWELETKLRKLTEKFGSYTSIRRAMLNALVTRLDDDTMELLDLNGDGKVNTADEVMFYLYYNKYYSDGQLHINDKTIMDDKKYEAEYKKRNRYTTTKYLKIYINKEHIKNYLGVYLKKYLNKIDDTVVFCQPHDNRAIYYGIDVNTGGFAKIEDNYFNVNYKKQQTINRFDYNICDGFRRNRLIMKQIIPLSFYFDVYDLLSDLSIGEFSFANIKVTGAYYNYDNEPISMNDFSIDYENYYVKYLKLNEKYNVMDYAISPKNVMKDRDALGLSEGSYYRYIFANKISPTYTRWKLKYSTDELPYITNMSRSYNVNKKYPYRYGEFPFRSSMMPALANTKFANNEFRYNLILPLGTTKKYYMDNFADLPNMYLEKVNNYFTSWFSTTTHMSFADNSIFSPVKDNKVYYKGILYNLNNLMTYTNKHYDINYFGVILRPVVNNIYDQNNIFTSILLKHNEIGNVFINPNVLNGTSSLYSHNMSGAMDSFTYNRPMKKVATYIANGDEPIVKDPKGNIMSSEEVKTLFASKKYIDLNDPKLINNPYEYYTINKYYSLYELSSKLAQHMDLYHFIENNTNIVDGYLLLPIYNVQSIIDHSDSAESLIFRYFSNNIKKKLYHSTKDDDIKTKLYNNVNDVILAKNFINIEQEYYNTFYIKDQYVSSVELKYLIDNTIDEVYPDSQTAKIILNHAISNINGYSYNPYFVYNNIVYARNVFTKIDPISPFYFWSNHVKYLDDNVLYIDSYNLDTISLKYNFNFSSTSSKILYARFLNDLHFRYFITDLYKTESDTIKDKRYPFNSIYIKIRCINPTKNDVSLVDKMISLYDILQSDLQSRLKYLWNKTDANSRYELDNLLRKIFSYFNGSQSSEGLFTIAKEYVNKTYKKYFTSLNDKAYVCELYFKKKFYKLTKDILKVIKFIDSNNDGAYLDMYFYRPLKQDEYSLNIYFDNNNLPYDNNLSIESSSDLIIDEMTPAPDDYIVPPVDYTEEATEHITEEPESELVTDIFFTPVFNNIFIQHKHSTLLYAEYQLFNLTELYTSNYNKIYYRYNTNECICMLEVELDNFKYLDNGVEFSIYEEINSTAFNRVIEHNDLELPYELGVNSYYHNGKLYVYYLADVVLDNSSSSFNIIGQLKTDVQQNASVYRYDDNIKYFFYVNGQTLFNEIVYNKVNNAALEYNTKELYKFANNAYTPVINDNQTYYTLASQLYTLNTKRIDTSGNTQYFTKTIGDYAIVDPTDINPDSNIQYYINTTSYSYEAVDSTYTGQKYILETSYNNMFDAGYNKYDPAIDVYYKENNSYAQINNLYYLDNEVYIKVEDSDIEASLDTLYYKDSNGQYHLNDTTQEFDDENLYYKQTNSNIYYALNNIADLSEEIAELLDMDTLYYYDGNKYVDINSVYDDREYYIKTSEYKKLELLDDLHDYMQQGNKIYKYVDNNYVQTNLDFTNFPFIIMTSYVPVNTIDDNTPSDTQIYYKRITSSTYTPISNPTIYVGDNIYIKNPDIFTPVETIEETGEYYVINTNPKYVIATGELDKTGNTQYYTYNQLTEVYTPVIDLNEDYYVQSTQYNLSKNLNEIAPFLKINLLDEFKVLAHYTLVQPITFRLKHDLSFKEWSKVEGNNNLQSKETSILYGSKLDEGTILLERYFDSITPLITPIMSITNNYFIKKKITKDTILKNANSLSTRDCVIYQKPISINTYPGITLWEKNFTATNSSKITSPVGDRLLNPFYPTEWKFYNDNQIINTPSLLEYTIPGYVTRAEILEYQKDDKSYALDIFTSLINKNRKNNPFSDSDILFLFKKYEVKYDVVPMGLNENQTEKVYTFTYKFILL